MGFAVFVTGITISIIENSLALCFLLNRFVSASLLQTSFQISYLDLSHNEFGEAAGILLGEALGELEF